MHGGGAKHASKVLKELAEVTGGQAYFPKSLAEVEPTCVHIARDVRNQYTLAYYPSNTNRDGTFRNVRVEAYAPGNRSKLMVRTRTGYFAPKGAQSAAANGR
jgi:VWFA-related protein